MPDDQNCEVCGQELRNVYWCRACRISCCSLACLARHRPGHLPQQPGDRPPAAQLHRAAAS